jgi:hypothetical protein
MEKQATEGPRFMEVMSYHEGSEPGLVLSLFQLESRPDLDHSKAAVLASLRLPEYKQGYRHATDEFIQWSCFEPCSTGWS